MSKIFEALQRAEKLMPETPAPAHTPTHSAASSAIPMPPVGAPREPEAVEPETAAEQPAAASAGQVTVIPRGDREIIHPEQWAVKPMPVSFSPRSKAVVAQNPTSLAAEQYRVLRTNIIKLSQTQVLKAVLVTSPGPGDGKTLTALNLALSFCQRPNTRVLLLEADLRKPSLGALVVVEEGSGVSEYLDGTASIDDVIRSTNIPNFFIANCGKVSKNPADLLNNGRLGRLMEAARSHFDWVILDGPPINPVADHELLTGYSDGVLLVVRPFYTQRDLLRLTAENLRGKKILGVCVNGSKHFERYGSAYGYGYGYGPDNEAEPRVKGSRRKKRFPRAEEE